MVNNIIFEYIIPLPPITKKNSQNIVRNAKTNKPFIIQNKKYLEYEKDVIKILPKKIFINYPVNVKCLFYMPTRRKVDKINLEASIHDILVKGGILADDNRDIIASTDGTRVYYDKFNPRTEIIISLFNEGYEQWKKL